MILRNTKSGVPINTSKISLKTLVECLTAKGYTSDKATCELANTQGLKMQSNTWHSYHAYVTDGVLYILHCYHKMQYIMSKLTEDSCMLSNTICTPESLTRFSINDVIPYLNQDVIEELGLWYDEYMDNIQDQYYNATGIPMRDFVSILDPELVAQCQISELNEKNSSASASQPKPKTSIKDADPRYQNYNNLFGPNNGIPMVSPFPYIPQAMPAYPIPPLPTPEEVMGVQPETISVLGTKWELSAKDTCPHVNVATGQSALELKKHHGTGETYARCPICGAIWVDKPVTPEAVKEAWYVIKSAIEFLKTHKWLTHQMLKDLIATDLNVFGLDMEVARAQGRTDYPKPFFTMPQEKASEETATKETKQDTTNESKQPDNSSK